MRTWLALIFLSLAAFVNGQTLVMEVGVISMRHHLTHITLNEAFVDPVVIALPASFNGPHEVSMRVNNVTPTGFDIYMDEPINRDGPHTYETIHYLVVEKGSYTFADGTMLEAGTISLSNADFQPVNFQQNYGVAPAIMTQLQTDRGNTRFLHTRQHAASGSGFLVRLEREELYNFISPDSTEEVGYFAIEKGTGVLDGVNFEAGSFTANETVSHLNFSQDFNSDLHFLGAIGTYNGSDPVTLRHTQLDSNSVSAFVQEDISADSEVSHSNEGIDFLAIDDNHGQGIFLDVSLAIELLDFEAVLTDGGEVSLDWITTDAYTANDRFQVERSPNGSDWQSLVEVNAPAYISGNLLHFGTQDAQPFGSITYYRLKRIEIDGSTTYSEIRSVKLEEEAALLSLYPLPAADYLVVEGLAQLDIELMVYNLAGQNLTEKVGQQQEGQQGLRLDVSQLASGYYVLKSGSQSAKFAKL